MERGCRCPGYGPTRQRADHRDSHHERRSPCGDHRDLPEWLGKSASDVLETVTLAVALACPAEETVGVDLGNGITEGVEVAVQGYGLRQARRPRVGTDEAAERRVVEAGAHVEETTELLSDTQGSDVAQGAADGGSIAVGSFPEGS